MAKVTRQKSGVVSGDLDVSRRTTTEAPKGGVAGRALANRKQAAARGKKAAVRAKTAAKTARKPTPKKAPGVRRPAKRA